MRATEEHSVVGNSAASRDHSLPILLLVLIGRRNSCWNNWSRSMSSWLKHCVFDLSIKDEFLMEGEGELRVWPPPQSSMTGTLSDSLALFLSPCLTLIFFFLTVPVYLCLLLCLLVGLYITHTATHIHTHTHPILILTHQYKTILLTHHEMTFTSSI